MTLALVRQHTQAQFLAEKFPLQPPWQGSSHTCVCDKSGYRTPTDQGDQGTLLFSSKRPDKKCCFGRESGNGAQENSGSWAPIHEQVEKRKCRKERRDWKWLVGPCRPHQCIRISQQPPSARALTVPCFSAHSFFDKEAWLNWGWLEGSRC